MTFTCQGVIILFFGQLTCQLPPAPPPADTFCTRYQPIYWAAGDTRGTKEQVDKMNRRWKSSCGKSKKG